MDAPEESPAVEREAVVPASAEETWHALTDPNLLEEWLAEDVELDLHPGGDLRARVDGKDREGFVEEADAPHRLVFWWAADGEESSRVEIDLTEVDGETQVRIVESRPLFAVEEIAIDSDSGLGGGAAEPQMSAALTAAG
jgi:uncharacterized protein YndB with AHSA1/START domain